MKSRITSKRNMISNSRRMKFTALILIVLLTGTAIMGLQKSIHTYNIFAYLASNSISQPVYGITEKSLIEYEQAIIAATKKAMPAIVTINTFGTRIVEIRDPFLRMFYGGRVGRQQKILSMGSGVIISPDGIVITNDHVIGLTRNSMVNIKVTLTDGRTFTAKLVKSFPSQDIAILSIDGKNFPYIRFASSSDVIQGQTAIAIGNPFGRNLTEGLSGGEPTVTRGIISAKKRSLTIETDGVLRYYRNMLQTDASINEGNSGGALINIEGKLIGINTAIYTAGGKGSIGIGFAIPSDRVKLIYERVKKYGDIGDTYVGINVEEMTKAMKDIIGLKTDGGIIITTVEPGSPGEKGGFRKGDVITGVNGLIVKSIEEAQWMFKGAVPGEIYTLTIFRDGNFMEKELKLGAK